MRSSLRAIAAASAAVVAGITACSSPTRHPTVNVTSGTVVKNVTVIDTRTGAATPGQAVVIDQGKIQQVLPSAAVNASGNARVIDASGKFASHWRW